jgi:demethylmenaquinone methyltransferase/2-methoxy-6-polyprenyl-1,4-benzoquinol methylase
MNAENGPQPNSTSNEPRPARPNGGSGSFFDGIADRYDLLNRIISLGIDQKWRRKTVRSLEAKPGDRILDLATGTADLSIMTARMVPGVSVTGVDPSSRMLAVGQRKLAEKELTEEIELQIGDAQGLPFEDNAFAGTTIAFGIRNVPDRLQGLKEMARVTQPGGRVAILELSEPEGGIMGPMARFHVHTLVPFIGGILSGAKEYRYLQESIAAFPPASEFSDMMVEAGLDIVNVESLTFGVAHLYVGTPRA